MGREKRNRRPSAGQRAKPATRGGDCALGTRGQSPWRSRESNERRRSASTGRNAAQERHPCNGATQTDALRAGLWASGRPARAPASQSDTRLPAQRSHHRRETARNPPFPTCTTEICIVELRQCATYDVNHRINIKGRLRMSQPVGSKGFTFWNSGAISSEVFFRVSKCLRPFKRIYRRFRPMPTSPKPSAEIDKYSLKLVPAAALTVRMIEIIKLMGRFGGGLKGDYAEFGVYNGTSMSCMASALSQTKQSDVHIYGFDSFAGLPPGIASDDGGVWYTGQFECPKALAIERLRKAGLNENKFTLVEGWYSDTLNVESPSPFRRDISIVLIDCDAYTSAKLVLNYIHNYLSNISIVMFDDWKLNDLDIKNLGEYRAFGEFLRENPSFRARAMRGYNRKSKIFALQRVD